MIDMTQRSKRISKRRCTYAVLAVMLTMLLSVYLLIVDDAFLPDDVLDTLTPPRWLAFRNGAPPVATTHPLLHRYGGSDNRPSHQHHANGLFDMEALVRRWRDLGDVSDLATSPRGGPAMPPSRPRRAWNGLRGVFLETFPDGRVQWHDAGGGWGHYRLRKTVIKYVEDAIHRHVRRHAVFHVGVDDNDVFHVLATYPESDVAQQTWRIIADHPTLYFVHWNPTLVDARRGLIGPRMIPIPDYEHFYVRRVAVANPREAFPDHAPVFGWRGGSTGAFLDYKQSDRSVVVRMLNDDVALRVVSDVKFDGIGEFVTPLDVPSQYLAPAQSPDIMSTRAFHLDIDGNANSWRGTRWKLASGVPTIKVVSPFIQWYYPLLRDGEHVLLWDVDDKDARDAIARWAHNARRDYADLKAMAGRAGALAGELFHRKPAEAVIYDSFQHLDFFEQPRDWRIRPNSAARMGQIDA